MRYKATVGANARRCYSDGGHRRKREFWFFGGASMKVY